MRTREEAERLAAIEAWLSDPFTEIFIEALDREEVYWDRMHRANIRVPGNPYATAENHAWTDGMVHAIQSMREWFVSPETFDNNVMEADDE